MLLIRGKIKFMYTWVIVIMIINNNNEVWSFNIFNKCFILYNEVEICNNKWDNDH